MTSLTAVAAMPSRQDMARGAHIPLWDFVRSTGLRPIVIGASKDPNAKITMLLVSEQTLAPVLAIKAPTTDVAAEAVNHEVSTLREFATRRLGSLDSTIPAVLDTVEFDGRTAAVTTAVPGVPMTTTYMRRGHTRNPRRVARDFAAVEDWLCRFQAATRGESSSLEMDAGVVDHLRRRFDGEPGLLDDVAKLEEIHAGLRLNSVPRTAVHGDLWLGNLLLSGSRISGVVDWEAAATVGEPVRDLVRFAGMYALYLDRRTRNGRSVRGLAGLPAGAFGGGFEFAVEGAGWFPAIFRGFLSRGLARLGASPEAWRDAALAGVAEVAALTDEPSFAWRHLDLFRRLTDPRGRRRKENS